MIYTHHSNFTFSKKGYMGSTADNHIFEIVWADRHGLIGQLLRRGTGNRSRYSRSRLAAVGAGTSADVDAEASTPKLAGYLADAAATQARRRETIHQHL